MQNAVAVAKYFVALFPYVTTTGDFRSWDHLSGRTCRYCANVRDIMTKMREAGHRSVGGADDIGFGTASRLDDDSFVAAIDLVQHPSRTVDDDGRVVESFPDTLALRAHVELTWTGSRWRVDGVDVERLGTS